MNIFYKIRLTLSKGGIKLPTITKGGNPKEEAMKYQLTDKAGNTTTRPITTSETVEALETRLGAPVGDGDIEYLYLFNEDSEQVARVSVEDADTPPARSIQICPMEGEGGEEGECISIEQYALQASKILGLHTSNIETALRVIEADVGLVEALEIYSETCEIIAY